jgi:hypothetical protein
MTDMNGVTVKRNAGGQLLPGSRLNPGGRPRATHLRLAAIREYYDRIAGKPSVAVDTTVTNDIGANIGALYLQAVQAVNQSHEAKIVDAKASPDSPAASDW